MLNRSELSASSRQQQPRRGNCLRVHTLQLPVLLQAKADYQRLCPTSRC